MSDPPSDGYISKGRKWASEHPYQAVGLGAALAVAAAPSLVAAPALGCLGFGANGVIGSSIAASAQAGIGNVAGGSAFATFQSAAAGGYGAAIVNGAVQGMAGVGAGIGVALSFRGKKKTKGEYKAKL